MKKLICFPVAFLTSVLMFAASVFFIRLNTGLMQPLVPAKIFMIALQFICALKFTLLVIALMPARPRLKSMSLGFILADLVIILSGVYFNGTLSVPVTLVIVQGLLIVFYMALQGRLWLYKNSVQHINIKNELITSPI